MFPKILASSRYLMIILVLVTFLGFLFLILTAAVDTVQTVMHVFDSLLAPGEASKEIVLDFIKITDLVLLSIVLYIISLGLYELFIDDHLPVPKWAEMHSLDDLKHTLLTGIIVLLAVLFLSYAEDWDHSSSLLYLGLSIAAVIFALTYFMGKKPKNKEGQTGENKKQWTERTEEE
jgi:uncharacterized membrane protein YqhA